MSAQIQRIKDLVGNDEVEEAIELLIKATNAAGAKREHQSALLLSARFKEYEQNKLNNTLSEKLLGTEIAAIRQNILELADNLSEAEGNAAEDSEAEAPPTRIDRAYNIVIKSLLLLLLVISVGVLIIGVMFPQLSQGGGDVEDGRIFLFGVSTTGIASSAFFYPRIAKKSA